MGRGRDTIRKRDDVEEQFVSSLRFSLSLSFLPFASCRHRFSRLSASCSLCESYTRRLNVALIRKRKKKHGVHTFRWKRSLLARCRGYAPSEVVTSLPAHMHLTRSVPQIIRFWKSSRCRSSIFLSIVSPWRPTSIFGFVFRMINMQTRCFLQHPQISFQSWQETSVFHCQSFLDC